MTRRTLDDGAGMNAKASTDSPSSWRHRAVIMALAAAGLAISTYLALHQFGIVGAVWDPLFGKGSERVVDSWISRRLQRQLGIPDAALGALAYFVELVLTTAGSSSRWKRRPWLVALFGMNTAALGVASVTLVVLQVKIVHAWCFLCLVSAAISMVIAFMSDREVSASLKHVRAVWQNTHDRGAFWRAFFGTGA